MVLTMGSTLSPDSVAFCEIAARDLFVGWNDPVENPLTQTMAFDAMGRSGAAVVLVPSVVVPAERCIVIDPEHRDFVKITFGEPALFAYDGRLIRQSK